MVQPRHPKSSSRGALNVVVASIGIAASFTQRITASIVCDVVELGRRVGWLF